MSDSNERRIILRWRLIYESDIELHTRNLANAERQLKILQRECVHSHVEENECYDCGFSAADNQ